MKKLEIEGYKVAEDIAVLKILHVEGTLLASSEVFSAGDIQLEFSSFNSVETRIEEDGWVYIGQRWYDNPIITFTAENQNKRDKFLKNIKEIIDEINNEKKPQEDLDGEILIRVF